VSRESSTSVVLVTQADLTKFYSYIVHLDIKGNLDISLTDFLDDDYDGIGLYGTTTDPDDDVDVVYRASKISSASLATTMAATQSTTTPTPMQSTNPNGGADMVLVSPTVALLSLFFLIANLN
jgi:hypothetical protein